MVSQTRLALSTVRASIAGAWGCLRRLDPRGAIAALSVGYYLWRLYRHQPCVLYWEMAHLESGHTTPRTTGMRSTTTA
jgi:hypothetical protein